MDVKIKDFEKRAIDAVSEVRNLLGAESVFVYVRVDKRDKECKTDVTFMSHGCKDD